MQAYKNFISEFTKTQMVLLGNNLAVDTANQVDGLELGRKANLIGIKGDEMLITNALIAEFRKLSEPVTFYVVNLLSVKYPDVVKELDVPTGAMKFTCPLISHHQE